jgi:hypothetical protein
VAGDFPFREGVVRGGQLSEGTGQLFVLAVVLAAGGLAGCRASSANPISVTVSPASASIPVGQTAQFTATVNNTSNPAVTWQLNGVAGGNSTVGTISTSGLYTAPLTPPPGGTATIIAVSQAAGGGSGNATAAIGFSNASLQGSYAFSFTGTNVSGFLTVGGIVVADGSYAFSFSGIDRFGNLLDLAGQFTADGSGSITSGMLDGAVAGCRFVARAPRGDRQTVLRSCRNT